MVSASTRFSDRLWCVSKIISIQWYVSISFFFAWFLYDFFSLSISKMMSKVGNKLVATEKLKSLFLATNTKQIQTDADETVLSSWEDGGCNSWTHSEIKSVFHKECGWIKIKHLSVWQKLCQTLKCSKISSDKFKFCATKYWFNLILVKILAYLPVLKIYQSSLFTMAINVHKLVLLIFSKLQMKHWDEIMSSSCAEKWIRAWAINSTTNKNVK